MVSGTKSEKWRTERPNIVLLCKNCDRFMKYDGESMRNCHVYHCTHCGNMVNIMRKELLEKEHPEIYAHAELEEA